MFLTAKPIAANYTIIQIKKKKFFSLISVSMWPFLWANSPPKILLQCSHGLVWVQDQKRHKIALYHSDVTLKSGVWLIKFERNLSWGKRLCWNMYRNFLTWQVNVTPTTYWSVGEADLIMLSDVFELYYPTVHHSPLLAAASAADIMLRDTVQQVEHQYIRQLRALLDSFNVLFFSF